ncbi:MAG: GNAT family N-acetyltransferase [Bacteroidales bacterium]|nr:GNAT family N-acetyltransferase [Bacteroidales bacterium]
MHLQGENIKLRAPELDDIDWMFDIENNDSYWYLSDAFQPFSRWTIENFIKGQTDIFAEKQYRFVAEDKLHNKIGIVDLYNFAPLHRRIFIGIFIDELYRNKHYGSQSIALAVNYCFNILQLHQVCALIPANNVASIKLFEKSNFQLQSSRKDWYLINGIFIDELFYNKFNEYEID